MMCIISKKRIAFCAQVEGTRGEVFAASPIALQSRCKRVANEPIPTYGHSWPSTPECSFKIGDRQSEKKQWNCDGRAICNETRGIGAGRGVSRHRDVSDGSDGPRPLWRSHSTRTEIFFADDPTNTQTCQSTVNKYWRSLDPFEGSQLPKPLGKLRLVALGHWRRLGIPFKFGNYIIGITTLRQREFVRQKFNRGNPSDSAYTLLGPLIRKVIIR